MKESFGTPISFGEIPKGALINVPMNFELLPETVRKIEEIERLAITRADDPRLRMILPLD